MHGIYACMDYITCGVKILVILTLVILIEDMTTIVYDAIDTLDTKNVHPRCENRSRDSPSRSTHTSTYIHRCIGVDTYDR